MTTVERIYEIEDYFTSIINNSTARLVSNQKDFDDILNLHDEKHNLWKSLSSEIDIQVAYNKIKPVELQRHSDIYCKTNIDKSHTRYYLKSDNLIKLIEFIIEQGLIKHINGITRTIKLIVDNFNLIKSHEYSDKIIQLLSTNDDSNIELVITMLGLDKLNELNHLIDNHHR